MQHYGAGAGLKGAPGAVINPLIRGKHATQNGSETIGCVRRARARRPRGRNTSAGRRRHDQGRRPALAVGHDGDQRDGAEGRRADGDRRDQRQGRRAGQEARAGGRRPGLELAAVRREGARSCITQDKVAVDLRLLDLGVAQVGAAGVRGAERPAVLPGAVRGRRALARTCSTPAPRPTSRRSRRSST